MLLKFKVREGDDNAQMDDVINFSTLGEAVTELLTASNFNRRNR